MINFQINIYKIHSLRQTEGIISAPYTEGNCHKRDQGIGIIILQGWELP